MGALRDHIKLLRPKDWAKNLFLFVPSFFAGNFFHLSNIGTLALGFITFSFLASCIYIINDYRDVEDDRKHPVKQKRPLASGKVKKTTAIIICFILFGVAVTLGYFLDPTLQLLFVLMIYFVLNFSYSMGLKNIAILDILILASGFVLRVKAGAIIAYLLALFMAIAKRRDDMLLKISTGTAMRKSIAGYNLDFLNTLLSMFSAVIIVAYIMYTVSDMTVVRLGTHRLYYTSVFVMAGLMRYLQITFVAGKSGSPTEILYKDRFIQITLFLWILSFYVILYLRGKTFFE
jgi:decaprenyl-phosphate phosphoribosyltransferase